MAVFLTILKIIGILVLVILLLVILAILCILFCPIRYYIEGQTKESTYLSFKFTWLFPVLIIKGRYEKQLFTTIRLLGIKIFDSIQQELHKKNPKKTKKKRKKKTTHSKDRTNKVKATKESKADENPASLETDQERITAKNKNQSKLKTKEKKDFIEENEQDDPNWRHKIYLFIKKIFEIIKNIKYTIKKWKNSILAFKEKIMHIKETKDWYVAVFTREESKRAIKKGKAILAGLLRHIAPQKGSGNIEFGLDDPALTGEVLGMVSMFYAFYGNHINIIPNFENINIFKADFYMKGRIRAFYILKCIWRVYFDKDIKQLYQTLAGGKSSE